MSIKLTDDVKLEILRLDNAGFSSRETAARLGLGKSTVGDWLREWREKNEGKDLHEIVGGPKILTFDIETAPLKAAVWRLFDQNIGLNMINKEWYLLSWSAKWFHENEVEYQDKRDSWDDEDDSQLLVRIWELLDEADIVVTQNGKRFDVKKLNARFIMNGMKPPSSYRHIDTLEIAKRHFGFTSNKLEWMTDKLCKKYKKLKHGKFPGYLLWDECLKGNQEAWEEMEEYNIYDVLSLEELYTILRPWFTKHPNLNLYYNDNKTRCSCGSEDLEPSGFAYTNLSKFTRFRCNDCGAEVRDGVNVLSKSKRQSLMRNV